MYREPTSAHTRHSAHTLAIKRSRQTNKQPKSKQTDKKKQSHEQTNRQTNAQTKKSKSEIILMLKTNIKTLKLTMELYNYKTISIVAQWVKSVFLWLRGTRFVPRSRVCTAKYTNRGSNLRSSYLNGHEKFSFVGDFL